MSRALGRYELLRPLARGGMAEVYLARRRAAGVEKWLVVKRIRPERATDPRFLDLFVREARLSMSLAHQNIVPVFDFGRIDDQVFIAMERVEGRDLGSSLARAKKPLPPVLAAFMAAECLQALDYAHLRRGPDGAALGIVHRDVTPRNVLLSWVGEVKLTDFGIAALAHENATSTKTAGTPAYMAPEQARGDALDARADVYAVGLVLREALTGVRARVGEERDSVLAAARSGELGAWPEGVEVDAALRVVCDRATSVNVEERYADAREMLEAIDAFIVGARAANTGERRAPARLLSGWLDEVWQAEKEAEDAAAASGEIEAQHLVSFMDDGELGVIGTGTAKSLAVTASEIALPGAAPPQASASSPALASAPASASASGAAAASDAARWMWPLALFGVGAIAAGAYVITHRGDGPVATQIATAPIPMPTQPPTPTPIPTPIPIPPPIVRDEHPVIHVRPRPIVTAPVDAPAAKPAAQLYRATITIAPWAFFTIDDSAAKHTTPEGVDLAPGPHQVHFSNPELHVDKTITLDMPARDFKWLAGKLRD